MDREVPVLTGVKILIRVLFVAIAHPLLAGVELGPRIPVDPSIEYGPTATSEWLVDIARSPDGFVAVWSETEDRRWYSEQKLVATRLDRTMSPLDPFGVDLADTGQVWALEIVQSPEGHLVAWTSETHVHIALLDRSLQLSVVTTRPTLYRDLVMIAGSQSVLIAFGRGRGRLEQLMMVGFDGQVIAEELDLPESRHLWDLAFDGESFVLIHSGSITSSSAEPLLQTRYRSDGTMLDDSQKLAELESGFYTLAIPEDWSEKVVVLSRMFAGSVEYLEVDTGEVRSLQVASEFVDVFEVDVSCVEGFCDVFALTYPQCRFTCPGLPATLYRSRTSSHAGEAPDLTGMVRLGPGSADYSLISSGDQIVTAFAQTAGEGGSNVWAGFVEADSLTASLLTTAAASQFFEGIESNDSSTLVMWSQLYDQTLGTCLTGLIVGTRDRRVDSFGCGGVLAFEAEVSAHRESFLVSWRKTGFYTDGSAGNQVVSLDGEASGISDLPAFRPGRVALAPSAAGHIVTSLDRGGIDRQLVANRLAEPAERVVYSKALQDFGGLTNSFSLNEGVGLLWSVSCDEDRYSSAEPQCGLLYRYLDQAGRTFGPVLEVAERAFAMDGSEANGPGIVVWSASTYQSGAYIQRIFARHVERGRLGEVDVIATVPPTISGVRSLRVVPDVENGGFWLLVDIYEGPYIVRIRGERSQAEVVELEGLVGMGTLNGRVVAIEKVRLDHPPYYGADRLFYRHLMESPPGPRRRGARR